MRGCCFGFHFIYTPIMYEIHTTSCNKNTKKLQSIIYDLFLFKNNWNADKVTIKQCSPRSCHMTKSKNGTYWTNTVSKDSTMNKTENKHQIFDSFESHVRLYSWNLIHSVGQNWWHAFSMDGKFAKDKLLPKVRPMNRVIYDLIFLQGKIISKEFDSSCESIQWSLKLRPV